MSKVYLVAGRATDSPEQKDAQVKALWQAARFDELFDQRDLTALKLHVGEPGTPTFVSPALAASLVRCISATGAKPFLTDTVVLYRSPRDNAITHEEVARQHGFGVEAMGAPFVGADGLNGTDETELPVGGRHFDKVAIASTIVQARSLLVLSHATGHLGTGFGGALKNLGMGCCSKKAKLRQHHGQEPRVRSEKCTACGTCADWCPADAITVEDSARIDSEVCIGCGECVAVCLDGAVAFDWGIMGSQLQERIVEHAAAIVRRKPGRIGYVTVAQNITKDCDCMGRKQKPVVEDIGILGSRDPVALDQAVMDLVRERAGATIESMTYPKVDGSVQLRYAEELGLGRRSVELITVSP